MLIPFRFSRIAILLLVGLGVSLLSLGLPAAGENTETAAQKTVDPWSSQETLQAAELVHEVAAGRDSKSPTVIYVGFRTLYEGGHIQGAVFHGTASTEKGLTELKSWLATLPRTTNLVIYCGCCPFDRCPNIRPAYNALREMGFEHTRVIILPTSFAKDWVEKGYPMEKGL
jgi:thiosulfate/3-mercaptopyruvate sulfurtransferase